MKNIYMDYAATNPLHPEVLDAMMPYFKEDFANPLSVYEPAVKAKEAIENARQQVASLINAKPNEIIFTSSGAESNNFAIKGAALANQKKGKHIITTKIEHHSITNSARFMERSDFTVTYLPVDKYGIVSPESVKKAIMDETILISINHANSEIGTIEPIAEIAKIAKSKNIIFHTDAVASTGNIPVDVRELNVDLLSLSAHQFYGPKGASALYLKEGTRIMPLIYGGIQEGGRRAGTENVPAIVGMGKAAEMARENLTARIAHNIKLRDKIIRDVSSIEKVHLTGPIENRLPGHASFVVEYIEGEAMLLLLAANGIYAASGSACTSKALKASPVLTSIGIPSHMAHGSVVFTIGQEITEDDIDYFTDKFKTIIKRLREMSPIAQ
ncbi:MAG: cysteine desulfurase family protein [Thermodesulfovibrionia bacterium]|nr:cysteine desulfurase family protein [Thermodesulfovibrionia bacterium]